MKTKITELQKSCGNDECSSDQFDIFADGTRRSSISTGYNYSLRGPHSTRKSIANDSKASVYFTPAESVDQTQLQLSPIHINYIKENLDIYLKPFSIETKLSMEDDIKHDIDDDYDVDDAVQDDKYHEERRFLDGEPSLMQSVMAYVKAHDDDEDDNIKNMLPGIMAINSENGSSNEDNCSFTQLNPLFNRKSKRFGNKKDLYYSLENVFDSNTASKSNGNRLESINDDTTVPNECSTLTSSSASDNCTVDSNNDSLASSGNHSNTEQFINDDKNALVNHAQSTFCLNNSHIQFIELQNSKSMPDMKQKVAIIAEVHDNGRYGQAHVILPIEENTACGTMQ